MTELQSGEIEDFQRRKMSKAIIPVCTDKNHPSTINKLISISML